jgi:hypothetical protein
MRGEKEGIGRRGVGSGSWEERARGFSAHDLQGGSPVMPGLVPRGQLEAELN